MTSIRRTLTVRLVTGTLVMLVAANALVGAARRSRVIREFDRALEAKARALVMLTSREGRNIETDFSSDYMPEFESEDNPEYFQMLRPDRHVGPQTLSGEESSGDVGACHRRHCCAPGLAAGNAD